MDPLTREGTKEETINPLLIHTGLGQPVMKVVEDSELLLTVLTRSMGQPPRVEEKRRTQAIEGMRKTISADPTKKTKERVTFMRFLQPKPKWGRKENVGGLEVRASLPSVPEVSKFLEQQRSTSIWQNGDCAQGKGKGMVRLMQRPGGGRREKWTTVFTRVWRQA